MNTIIPRFYCPFDEEVMLRHTWIAKPVPWWIHEGVGIMGMARIAEEVSEEEEADSDSSPFGEVDLDAEKSLFEWLWQETEEEEEKEWVLVENVDEDDDWLIYSQDSSDYDYCEVDGLGLPPSVPLPALPSLPEVSPDISILGQEMEPSDAAILI